MKAHLRWTEGEMRGALTNSLTQREHSVSDTSQSQREIISVKGEEKKGERKRRCLMDARVGGVDVLLQLNQLPLITVALIP